MRKLMLGYVRVVDRVGYVVGRATMYLIFAMVAVLFISSVTKGFRIPAIWTLDIAQFLMMAYFILGGAYSMQQDGHVRMDLIYGVWSRPTQRKWDSVTVLFLIFYLCVLLYGSISSLIYSIEFGERAFSAWRPYMWPIKAVMTFGILLMLLQAISYLFKDLAAARGEPLE